MTLSLVQSVKSAVLLTGLQLGRAVLQALPRIVRDAGGRQRGEDRRPARRAAAGALTGIELGAASRRAGGAGVALIGLRQNQWRVGDQQSRRERRVHRHRVENSKIEDADKPDHARRRRRGCGEVRFRHPEELMFKKSTRVDAAPIAQPYSEPTARDVRGSPDDAMMGCSEQLQSNARNRNLVCSASLATEAKQETESCNDRTEKNSVRCGDGLGRFGFLRGERIGGDRL